MLHTEKNVTEKDLEVRERERKREWVSDWERKASVLSDIEPVDDRLEIKIQIENRTMTK